MVASPRCDLNLLPRPSALLRSRFTGRGAGPALEPVRERSASGSEEKAMHPGFYYRWKRSQEDRCEGARASACGREGWRRHGQQHAGYHASDFGVRRPLRYMAHRLDLDDEQIDKLAAILNTLKTERAQARLDEQRSVAKIAEAIEGDGFDQSKVEEALQLRVTAAERLKAEVLATLHKTHEMLDAEQRKRLAYLLRSGQLTI